MPPPPPPPPPPNAVLGDINDVMDELTNVLARYEEIGGRLNIPHGKLVEIREKRLTPAAAMKRVIVEWLNRNYPNSSSKPPTWKALVDAVEHPVGGNNKAEAEEIARKHRAGESSRYVQWFKKGHHNCTSPGQNHTITDLSTSVYIIIYRPLQKSVYFIILSLPVN